MDRDDLDMFTRSLEHATSSHTGSALDAALDELGWSDALGIDAQSAVSILFDLQGRANATSSALSGALLDALGLDLSGHLVHPPIGTSRAPGLLAHGRVTVGGVATVAGAGAASSTVIATKAGSDDYAAVTVDTSELTLRAVDGLDPSLGFVDVSGDAAVTDQTAVDWPAAVRRAQLALSHELLGASRAMLDMARQHALERIQFGVPIASFQAVRHRLAEVLVAIEGAEAMLGTAWEENSGVAAAMSKALAGKAARTAARHSQQVLAGIGFTLEHEFHHYFRRILVLDECYGSARLLTKELGQQLITTRRLPPVPDL